MVSDKVIDKVPHEITNEMLTDVRGGLGDAMDGLGSSLGDIAQPMGGGPFPGINGIGVGF